MTTKPLRVLLIVTRADTIGGSHTHVATLARNLLDRGHEVLVAVGPPTQGPFHELLDRNGVPHTSIPSLVRPIRPWSDRRAKREIQDLIAQFRPDVVHCHSSKAGVVGRLAARSSGVPHVFTAHGWAFTDGVPRLPAMIWATVEKLVGRRCPGAVIVVSAQDKQIAVERKVLPAERMTVVHNGVADVAEDLLADPTARPATAVMVARLDAQKDHDTLVDALAQLDTPELRVLCVGDGPRTDEVRERIATAGLKNVELLGLRHDIDRILADAQFFILTTHWEGLPLSIVEAMRAGLPTLATDVGGVDELVEDGVTGYLVPRDDPSAVAGRLRDLLDDPGLAAELGARSRTKYLSSLTVDQMVDATLDVYDSAIAGALRN